MVWKKPEKFFHSVEKWDTAGMVNVFISAAMILFIFAMVIYLTKDM